MVAALIYRCVLEVPTYFWECRKAELEKVELNEWKYGVGISVTYKLDGYADRVFNGIAPIAIDQDYIVPIYPYRYHEILSSRQINTGCVSKDGKQAVLVPGFSKETFYYFCICMFLCCLLFVNKKLR